MKKNKVKIIVAIAIVLVLIGGIALSYAFFSTSDKQGEANTFRSGCLNITIDTESAAITLNNAYPISDIEGLGSKGYTFTIKNTCNKDTNYMINLESLNESSNTLDSNYLKVSLSSDTMDNLISKLGSNPTTETLITGAYEAHNLYNGTIKANTSKEFTLREWIDYNVSKEQGMNKTVTNKINVIARPDIEVTNIPEIKTTLDGSSLKGTITGNATSVKYCKTDKNVCDPSTNVTVTDNTVNISASNIKATKTVATALGNIEVNIKRSICTTLDNSKTYCSNILGKVDFSKTSPEEPDKVIANSVYKELVNVTNDETYPLEFDEATGIYTSTNKENNTKSTITFSPKDIGNYYICYEASTEHAYDKGAIYLDDTSKVTFSGTESDCFNLGEISSSNVIKVTYEKDSGSEYGNDEIKFYLSKDVTIEKEVYSGIYELEDGMYGGASYYYRGAVTNNYVKFGGFCWRIIRFNGDGSIRLIYDGTTCHANGLKTEDSIIEKNVYYHKGYTAPYAGYTYTTGLQRPTNNLTADSSEIKKVVDNWYNNNLSSYDDYIADGKFCNDREVPDEYQGNKYTWSENYYTIFGGKKRSYYNSPSLDCSVGDIYLIKIGLITSDEGIIAGGRRSNNLYYLYNGQGYWTMTPSTNESGFGPYIYNIALDGSVTSYAGVANEKEGVRPVINLKSTTTFEDNGADGTSAKPYVVKTL